MYGTFQTGDCHILQNEGFVQNIWVTRPFNWCKNEMPMIISNSLNAKNPNNFQKMPIHDRQK